MTQGAEFDYKQFRKDWDNLLERQKYKEAEKLCHEGLAKSPLDQSRGRLYNHLGYLYENFLDDKTFDDILEHYVLSLQVDESNANSHYNLANFLLEQGMQHLLRALELNPNHNKANKRYANLTPIKMNTTLDLGGHKYQVIEVVEDGVRAVRLRKRNDGGYERTDDEPVYVEVSSPEKVYPSSKKNKGRTSNMGANQPMALNIDDPNGGYGNNNNDYDTYNNESGGCCYKCIFHSWFWCLLWLIGLGGVVVPVLAYFNIFGTDECTNKITIQNVPINRDLNTQGSLNVLFVMNCDSNDWDKQFDAANTLLTQLIQDDNNVKYDIKQYCNFNNKGMYIGNDTSANDFIAYTSSSTALSSTSIEQEVAEDGNNNYISGALEACKDGYDLFHSDTTPFLCVPFVSFEFIDTFEAMTLTSDTTFGNIYLSFMVNEADSDYRDDLYSVLGSFTVGTECIAKVTEDYKYGNTWWGNTFNCNSDTSEQAYCQHCINYANDLNLECASGEISRIFKGEGVTETVVSENSDEEVCTHKYSDIFFYCIGGGVPLLFWVFIVILILCCKSCRNRRNRSNMEQSHGLNNNDNKQTAFV